MHVERLVLLAAVLGVAACAATTPPPEPMPPVEPVAVELISPVAAGDINLRAILAYYRKSRGMSGPELGRERLALQGSTGEPLDALRLAILLGQERSDLARALGLLDDIAKDDSTQALALQPFARLLSDQYAERLKLETQIERLGTSIREADRRAAQLQEKIDALADIERNLPGRPGAVPPAKERSR